MHISYLPTQWSVNQLIEEFRSGNIAIPEIQRDVVWKADQIKALIDSLNRNYPCGSLILWEPRERDKGLVQSMIRPERLSQFQAKLPRYFLLDGQQRASALVSVFLGRDIVKNLLSELEEEMPYLFLNLKKISGAFVEIETSTEKSDYKYPWVPLNNVLNQTIFDHAEFKNLTDKQRNSVRAFAQRISNYQFPVQIVSNIDYATAGEIFSRVNSSGTELTGAEIHLAKIVPVWRGITAEFRNYRKELRKAQYDLDLTFLMRIVTAVDCGTPQIKKLAEKVDYRMITKKDLNKTWRAAKSATNKLLKWLREDLGLDKSKFFTSKNVLVPLVYHISCHKTPIHKKNVLTFFLLSQMSERYGSAAETRLKKDFRFLTDASMSPRKRLESLVEDVTRETKQWYRGLKVKTDDIQGLPSKNIFVLLMYAAMRKRNASDFGLNRPLYLKDIISEHMQLHHIFPFNLMMEDAVCKKLCEKHYLTPAEYRNEVNDIANLTFISQEKNASIGDLSPSQYLDAETTPSMRAAHFIPQDKRLWGVDNYFKFLAERRKLLAEAINSLLRTVLS